MATTAIHSKSLVLWDREAAHRVEHQLLCGLKQKAENGREETSRQEGIRFLPKCVGYSCAHFHWLIRKGRAFPEANCLVSLRSERRRVFVGLFSCAVFTLHNLRPLIFLSLSLFFPNVLLYSLNRMYSKRYKLMTSEEMEVYILVLMYVT